MQKVVENYILYESVGSGQYGKVYRAKNQKTNETVAIKVIPLEKFTQVPKLEEFTGNEIKTLARISNPNVVRFIEMLKTANNTYLVYEFCNGGTIEDTITKKHHISESESIKIFKQVINAFKSIYKENILHRDLKPSNILFHEGVIKVADFGFCKKMASPQELTFTMVGSPIYMAPEILKGYPYNIKSDIWSLGVLLYEMLFGICPYEDKNLAGLISRIDTQPLTFPMHINRISKNTENALRKMLTVDHKTRIEWSELLEYNFGFEESSAGISKIDLNTHHDEASKPLNRHQQAHNEAYQKTLQQYETILKALMRQRSKIVYMSNVVHSILEQNLNGRAPVVGYLLLKKIVEMIEGVKKDISVENTSSKYNYLEKWEEFRMTEEYLTFSRYMNEEHEEAVVFLTAFKQEVQAVLRDIRDASFKNEVLKKEVSPKFLMKNIHEYVESIQKMAQDKIANKEESAGKKLLLHANEILDSSSVDDFFEKVLIETSLNLAEQSYFTLIKTYSKDKLGDIVKEKLVTVKNKA